MQMQTGFLARQLGHVNFICVDAPIAARGPPHPAVAAFFSGPFYEWWDAEESKDGGKQYHGVAESLAYIESKVADMVRTEGSGPDLLLGFSQGATLATLLTARAEKESGTGEAPWKAVVLLNGVLPKDSKYRLGKPIQTPSLHVLGKQDSLYQDGQCLAETCFDAKTRQVLCHTGGHEPVGAKHKDTLAEVKEYVQLLFPTKVEPEHWSQW